MEASDLLFIIGRYLYMGYELYVSMNGEKMKNSLILKRDRFDHTNPIFAIADVIEIETIDILKYFPNIVKQIQEKGSFEMWFEAGNYVSRIYESVTSGPYCENAQNVTVDDLEVRDDSIYMAFHELDTKIINNNSLNSTDGVMKKEYRPVEVIGQ